MPPGAPASSSVEAVVEGDVHIRASMPSARRSTKLPAVRKDVGTTGAVSDVGRGSTVLVRKRLPWLDGPQQSKPGAIPGHFESNESLSIGDAAGSPPSTFDNARSPTKKTSVSSLGRDPALRAIGSTPSLRKRARSRDFKSLSLNSQPRSGMKPVNNKSDAKRALGMANEQKEGINYASSEYSATASSDRESLPATLPNKDPSSYENLVQRQASTNQGSREPFHIAHKWLQSELDIPLDNEVSPGHSPNDEGIIRQHEGFPSQRRRATRRQYPKNDLKSNHQEPKLREPPKAKALRQRSMANPAAEPTAPALPPPPLPPTRRTTLFAMPTHLLPSSSSSSHDPTPQRSQLVLGPALPLSKPPVQPPRASSVPEVRRDSQSLNRAVTGLETLMEEALIVARNAAQNGRNDEVASILDSATLALRKASIVNGQMGTGRMSHPLVLSPSVSERDSESDAVGPNSDASSIRSNGDSMDTAPTLLTKSAQSSQEPLLGGQYKATGRSSVSTKPALDDIHDTGRKISPDRQSMTRTPPRLYQPPSVDSIVRDFAYARAKTAKAEAARQLSRFYGAASDYYRDAGQSVGTQPGVRPSLSAPMINDKPLPPLPGPVSKLSVPIGNVIAPPKGGRQARPICRIEPVPTVSIPVRSSSRSYEKVPDTEDLPRKRRSRHYRPHLSDYFESSYYHQDRKHDRSLPQPSAGLHRESSQVTDARYDPNTEKRASVSKYNPRYSGPTTFLQRNLSLRHPRRNHISLREGQGFSLGRYHRRQPIAREWNLHRKRIAAMIVCLNTVFIGLIAGIFVSVR